MSASVVFVLVWFVTDTFGNYAIFYFIFVTQTLLRKEFDEPYFA
jgi:hypothetical protein